MFHFIVFGIIAWIALAVLVMGVIYRVVRWVAPRDLTGLASVAVISYNWGASSRIGEVLKRILTFYTLRTIDPMLFWGTFLFHWGIFLTLFIGHIALFFTPGQLQAFGISPETRKIAAIYLGAAFGFITLIGLVMLWYRRLVKKEVRTFTYLDDWFALSLITLIVLLGVINTVVIHPDYVNTVTPWLINLLSGNIDVATKAISTAHPLLQLHIFLAEVLMIYVPLGKMIHPFSIFFQPTITTAPYKVKGSEEVSIKLS